MSNSSKEKALHADSAYLREELEENDQSIDFEAESKKDNHNLIRAVKEQIGKAIPTVRVFALIVFGVFVTCFIVMLIRYLYLIWAETEKISVLLFGTLKIIGAYIFGVLTPAIFKNKR